MLPKGHRLQKKRDFDHIFAKGKSTVADCFMAKAIPNALGKDRFAFVVSKKVSLKATVRNTIRRRMADVVIKSLKEKIPRPVHKDVVVIALLGAQKKSFLEIEEAIARLLKKHSL